MTPSEEQEIKQVIEEKIIQLEEEILTLKEMCKPLGLDNAVGRVSRMDYINNKSINEAQLRKNEEKLKGLRTWQEKLGTSDFGKCIRCGQEINIKRLLFMPESKYCIHCASRG
ncbi:MAG: TraR/DksA C4-type zinc finger protein [Cyclobacteriaceae bacterium]